MTFQRIFTACLTASLVLIASTAEAAPTTVARCTSETTILLSRPAEATAWRVVSEKDELQTGELLVGGPGVALRSCSGAVRLSFLGELAGTSTNPTRETAIILHDSKDYDLDVTLDRGRIDLVNTKKEGAARVRVRIRDRSGEVTLVEPGARVAAEIYGRWLPGVPFRKEPKAGEAPALALVVVALHGEVEVKGKHKHFFLKGPPGPALVAATTLDDDHVSPQFLEKLPEWAEGKESPRSKLVKEILGRFRRDAVEKSVGEAIDNLLNSESANDRRAAVTIMGATDDLRRLGQALAAAKHPDVWDNGVLALRHWIGRGPGQDQKLYKMLVEEVKMPAAQAQTVMHLLHSFGEDDVKQPATYQALIGLLESDRLAIRGLAHWHLYRLAPAGQKFGFDPLAPAEKRAEAVKRWRELIPPGKLPPPEANDE